MQVTSTTFTRSERALLDRAMRLLTDSLDLDDQAECVQLNMALRVWNRLTDAYNVECVEVEA